MITFVWWKFIFWLKNHNIYIYSVVRVYILVKKWWPMCGESYIRALCGGTSGCEGRSCGTLCRCVKVYFADTTRISHFPQTLPFTVHRAPDLSLPKVGLKKLFSKSVKVYWESVVGKGGAAACRVPLSRGKRCLVEGGEEGGLAGKLARRYSFPPDPAFWPNGFVKLKKCIS